MRLSLLAAATVALAAALSACQTGPGKEVEPADWSDVLKLADDGDYGSLQQALGQSLKWARTQPASRELKLGERTFTAGALADALNRWQTSAPASASPNDLLRTLPDYFDVFAVHATDGKLLVTGYYVPTMEGSLAPSKAYPVPVYPVPDDLITVALGDFGVDGKPRKLRGRVDGHKLVPYFERSQIRTGALKKRGLKPLAWVKDELDLFVVEIQGSGILRLPDGSEKVLGYAEENGRTYKPIGRLLLDEQKLSKDSLSMQAIRGYLTAHPAELGRVLSYNQSFVFFHFTGGEILGNLGEPLTAGRSIAADQRSIPAGVPLFLTAPRPRQAPDGTIVADGQISRFAFNQDTGGAVRGAGHVDFFWGEGKEAEQMAGMMRQQGTLYVFVPKASKT